MVVVTNQSDGLKIGPSKGVDGTRGLIRVSGVDHLTLASHLRRLVDAESGIGLLRVDRRGSQYLFEVQDGGSTSTSIEQVSAQFGGNVIGQWV